MTRSRWIPWQGSVIQPAYIRQVWRSPNSARAFSATVVFRRGVANLRIRAEDDGKIVACLAIFDSAAPNVLAALSWADQEIAGAIRTG